MNRRLLAILLAALVVSMPLTLAAELHLTYDANGNLVTGDGKYRVYNSLNQLAAIYNGTNSSATLLEQYKYHPTEERILVKKVYDNGSLAETIYYFSKTFVRVVNSSGSYDVTYVYHNGQLVAQRHRAGNKLFIHGNHEGSSSVVTNESGDVVERAEYAPFGEQLNSSRIRFGYEGKEQDSLVADTDFNFRKYKAEWGLFTQPDDVIQNVYDPQSLNRYSFERNNPYQYRDDTGHQAVPFMQGWEYILPGGAVAAAGSWGLVGGIVFFGYQGAVFLGSGARELAHPPPALDFEYGLAGPKDAWKKMIGDAVQSVQDSIRAVDNKLSGIKSPGGEIGLGDVLANIVSGQKDALKRGRAEDVLRERNDIGDPGYNLALNQYYATRLHYYSQMYQGTNPAQATGGSSGGAHVITTPGGGYYVTGNPNWSPIPAGQPGGKGGGSSFGDGGFGRGRG